MVRESLADDAAHTSAVAHGDGLTVLQWRVKKGMAMRDPEDEIFSPQKNIQTIQVERKGDAYTMRVAKKGEALQVVGSHHMPDLPTPLFVGFYNYIIRKISTMAWSCLLAMPWCCVKHS